MLVKRIRLAVLLLLASLFILGSPWFNVGVHASSFVSVTADPAGSGVGIGGFSRNHYASSIRQIISPFGTGPASGDNSVRALDPVTMQWTYIFPNLGLTCLPNCIPNRDNHVSFYVPAVDELWIVGGSHIEALPVNQRYYAGRLSLAGCHPVKTNCARWVATSLSYDAAFAGVIKNSSFGTAAFIDPANAWNSSIDKGITFGGSVGGNPSGRYWLIERNQVGGLCGGYGGTERYIMCEMPSNPKTPAICGGTGSGTTPGARDQAHNLLVAGDGPNFYLAAGHCVTANAVNYNTGDMWRLNGLTGVWTQLANPPWGNTGGYTPACAYDSTRNAVICWVDVAIYKYDIASNTWADVTPAGSPYNVFNQLVAYAPEVDLTMFQGGNDNKKGGAGFRAILGLKLSDGSNIPPRGGFSIPARTWMARPYSKLPRNPDAPGFGAGIPAAKHMNLRLNPENGKIYIIGGDSAGSQYANDSQGTWSYDIAADQWTEEYPQCGSFGDVVPGGPNESGLVWDSRRHKFWLLPGFWFLVQSGIGVCEQRATWNTSSPLVITGQAYYAVNLSTGQRWFPGSGFSVQNDSPTKGQQTLRNIGSMDPSVLVRYAPNTGAFALSKIMTFDPIAKKWSDPGAACEPLGSPPCNAQLPKNAAYDVLTDSIFRVGTDHRGLVWTQYVIASNTWNVYQTVCALGKLGTQGPCPSGQVYINDVDLQFEWITADVTNRKIYVIDPRYYRLFQFDMDSHQVTVKASPPKPPYGPCNTNGYTDFTQSQFDTVNNVLLYPWICSLADSRPRLFIYHPDSDTWEVDAMYQPDGLSVRGNHSVFDSVHNVLMVYGGLCAGEAGVCAGGSGSGDGGADPNLKHFFLYRYGDDSGRQVPPLPPSSLAIQPVSPSR